MIVSSYKMLRLALLTGGLSILCHPSIAMEEEKRTSIGGSTYEKKIEENNLDSIYEEKIYFHHSPNYLWQIYSPTLTLRLYSNPSTPNFQPSSVSAYLISAEGSLPPCLEKLGSWESVMQNKKEYFFLTSDPKFSLEKWGIELNGEETAEEDIRNESEEKESPFSQIKNIMNQQQQVYSYTVEEFVPLLNQYKHIVFILGAGISAANIWTLPDFHRQLSLEDLPATHGVTDESLTKFLVSFIKNPEKSYPIMSSFTSSLKQSGKPTEAHYALKNIVEFLKQKGKEITVYSGNFDKYEEKVGLEVKSEEELVEVLPGSSLLVVPIGLRSDHAALINRHLQRFPQVEVLSFNLTAPTYLKILLQEEQEEIVGTIKLKGNISGDIQTTLPQLKEELSKFLL